ncbi:hypothetical protein MELB17_17644 [Marinobacter sp. ELB17]|nr:hypothetical protein MELB17_17644 [Marinobacter sp. ELB17]
MSKRKRDAVLSEALWVVEYIDRMTPSDRFENEARKTSKNKSDLGYYQLRQQRKAK